ncbi:hypothetical protein QYF36_005013 [Acer negundo]|nr:hypothetical protein QYF36_005013 [Acer negundo]
MLLPTHSMRVPNAPHSCFADTLSSFFVHTLVPIMGVATHGHLRCLQRLPAVSMSPTAIDRRSMEVTLSTLPRDFILAVSAYAFWYIVLSSPKLILLAISASWFST